MYSTKLTNGLLTIRNGRNVLDIWDRNWRFADGLCELLNQLENGSALLLNEEDREWLKEIDGAFSSEVQHA
jgi:hypothetical protein